MDKKKALIFGLVLCFYLFFVGVLNCETSVVSEKISVLNALENGLQDAGIHYC